ncbi:unnamed protein product [Vitrella brassicaformis CCMP3155]|uniref:Uncharacterized protein n=2 Tax=Vitrella brassicaformis TaxID=1169539 RepID=A0A0G4GS28_VITBC|nr:unnamed protein product [Vitrella brassicaformis CCMP3155]|eukprot:CEM33417.1 unnamed protein product [Vitrella brassicaformis CCMP3155]
MRSSRGILKTARIARVIWPIGIGAVVFLIIALVCRNRGRRLRRRRNPNQGAAAATIEPMEMTSAHQQDGRYDAYSTSPGAYYGPYPSAPQVDTFNNHPYGPDGQPAAVYGSSEQAPHGGGGSSYNDNYTDPYGYRRDAPPAY